jgi:hypothetical protein
MKGELNILTEGDEKIFPSVLFLPSWPQPLAVKLKDPLGKIICTGQWIQWSGKT